VLALPTAGARHKKHLRHSHRHGDPGDSTEQAGPIAPLTRGTRVVLKGLQKAADLNGKHAVVEKFLEGEGRYLVQLVDGSYRKVTPDHMDGFSQPSAAQPAEQQDLAPSSEWPKLDGSRAKPGDHVLVQGLHSEVALNGKLGDLRGFDKISGRFIVTVAGASKRIKPSNLRHASAKDESVCQRVSPAEQEDGPSGFSPGTEVVLQGLSSQAAAALNEQTAVVHCFDKESGRYVVQIADGTPRRIKPSNLRAAASASDTASDDDTEDEDDAPDNAPVDEVSDVADAEDPPKAEESISPGSNAKLHGLRAAEMNGKVVRVSSFDKKSGRFVVKMPSGELRKVEESHLRATSEVIQPQLSICNAYGPKRSSIKVSAISEHGTPQVIHVLPFHACVDLEELPFQDGSISFSAGGQEVARLPYAANELKQKGTEVTVYRTDLSSQASLHQNAIEKDDRDAYYLHLVNAYVGSRPGQLSVQRGAVTKVLALDRSYRMEKMEDITLVLTDGHRRLKLAFKPQKSRTYAVVMTGADATDKDDAHSAGLVLHELGAWTSAEELEAEA